MPHATAAASPEQGQTTESLPRRCCDTTIPRGNPTSGGLIGDEEGNETLVIGSSIPAVLREQASLQPNRTAFTFIDYEQDWAGVAESLTWSQLYRRALNLAQELRLRGSTGDRSDIGPPRT